MDRQDKLLTLYWLPKLHQKYIKHYVFAISGLCTNAELPKLLTSCLTAVKIHDIRYCKKIYERSGKKFFWSIKTPVRYSVNVS